MNTPKLEALLKRHGPLGSRLLQIRTPQQEEVANAAYEEGFIPAMTLLEVTADDLGECMQAAGYGQCAGCEEWFPVLELEPVEPEIFEDGASERSMCEDCKLAEEGDWSAPPPPEPTTPEEIAAAEEKKRKAREAVIRQEERAEQRAAIVEEFERSQEQSTD